MSYNERDNAYTTDRLLLSGDCILHVEFNGNERLAIRKSNTGSSPWPVVLMSPPTDKADVYIHGRPKGKYIKVQTSERPAKVILYKV